MFFDYNFMPYIAVRDVREDSDIALQDEFFEVCQMIAAAVLSRKYNYQQISESGVEIIKKDKIAAFLCSCQNIEELHAAISERANKLHLSNRDEMIHLDRKKYHLKFRILIGTLFLFLVLLCFTGYQTFLVLPRDKAVIQASRAFTVQNYVDCIDQLQNIGLNQMDTYTKYILAVSYARCEALEKAELQNVLDRLSIYSNEIELEYWVVIGRADYALAENYAKALSDDKLLIYAYMKELTYLEGNVTTDGEEKQSRMNELSNAITEISKKYME